VGNNGFPDIQTYQLGYYEATIALIDSAKKSKFNVDGLVYPIVFSARHAIELFLKNQLYNLKYINAKAQGKDFESKLQTTHSIKVLWEGYKQLTKVDLRYEPYTKELEDYIIDFYEVDDTGETFRYPFDHEEIRHLTDFGCINIEIFEDRFIEMYKIVDDLKYLTEFLTHEYREGTFVRGLSRIQIREIAKELPPKKDWIRDEFLTIKKEILRKYNISSNTFSKAVTLIKNHKEFASYIGIEIPLKEIDCDDLKKFINIYKEYRSKFKTDSYVDILNNYTNTVCEELSVDNIYALSALFDIAFFDLYPEAYERITEEKKENDIFGLVFGDLSVGRGIILERIQIALAWLGQKTLLKAF
jgi:hypothetical protein